MLHISLPVLEVIATRWKPIYSASRDDGDCETLAVTVIPRIEARHYSPIVDNVDLLVNSELTASSIRKARSPGISRRYGIFCCRPPYL